MKRIHWSSIANDFVETRINGNPANSENKQMDQSELEERTQETGAKMGNRLHVNTSLVFSTHAHHHENSKVINDILGQF